MKIKINWAKNNGKSWRPAFHYSKEKPIATLMNFELNGKEYTENIYSVSTLAGRVFDWEIDSPPPREICAFIMNFLDKNLKPKCKGGERHHWKQGYVCVKCGLDRETFIHWGKAL